jgi:hypothetical protein
MRVLFRTLCVALALQTTTLFAQFVPQGSTQVPATPEDGPGCGNAKQKFDVSTQHTKGALAPDPEKALLVIIENDDDFQSWPKPAVRIGLDGQWKGATHGNSYLAIPIEPGVHHLCANWQKYSPFIRNPHPDAVHFTAVPGVAYYFEAHNSFNLELDHIPHLQLKPLDSDQGKLLAASYPVARSHPK